MINDKQTKTHVNTKKNPIHGQQTKKRFYGRKWFLELLASGPPAIAATAAAIKSYQLENASGVWIYLAVGLVWLVVAQIFKVIAAYRQDAKDDELHSHDGLQAALTVLHAVVYDALIQKNALDPGLRTTFHRVVPPLSEPEHLEQIVPYIGGHTTGDGRIFSISAGITGCAVREKQVLIMDRRGPSDEEYRKELIAEWHYTEATARKMTMDRFSAIAVPVKDKTGEQVLGVIFMDATRKNCFSSEDVQKLVIAATGGITKYVGKRYV